MKDTVRENCILLSITPLTHLEVQTRLSDVTGKLGEALWGKETQNVNNQRKICPSTFIPSCPVTNNFN
jgi:hypothetical protein